jgi:hypothetical protein
MAERDRRRQLALTAVTLTVIFVLFSLTAVTRLEERDSFCISCHLAPEVTYYDRAVQARTAVADRDLPDLAAAHYWREPNFRCVDCHRGADTVPQRARVLALAAADVGRFVSGRYDTSIERAQIANVNANQEAWLGPERYSRAPAVLNAGCYHCHQETLTLVGFDNHFHNKLPAAAVAREEIGALTYPVNWPPGLPASLDVTASVLTCLDCHRSHAPGFAAVYFLDQARILLPACVQCHLEAGQGPLDLDRR